MSFLRVSWYWRICRNVKSYLNSILTQPPCKRTLTGWGSRVYPNGRGSRARPGQGSRVFPTGWGSRARPGRGRGCARALPLRLALRSRGLGFALAVCAMRSQFALCAHG